MVNARESTHASPNPCVQQVQPTPVAITFPVSTTRRRTAEFCRRPSPFFGDEDDDEAEAFLSKHIHERALPSNDIFPTRARASGLRHEDADMGASTRVRAPARFSLRTTSLCRPMETDHMIQTPRTNISRVLLSLLAPSSS